MSQLPEYSEAHPSILHVISQDCMCGPVRVHWCWALASLPSPSSLALCYSCAFLLWKINTDLSFAKEKWHCLHLVILCTHLPLVKAFSHASSWWAGERCISCLINGLQRSLITPFLWRLHRAPPSMLQEAIGHAKCGRK